MLNGATILYCHCAYSDVVPEKTKRRVLEALGVSGRAFVVVPDLCELAARRDPALKRIAAGGAVKIAACYPRAVKWLFAAAGAPLPEEGAEVLNMRVEPAERIVRSLLDRAVPSAPTEHRQTPFDEEQLAAPGEWIPWFPVIDHDRCKGCKQCLNFCLFGVYGASADGIVSVENPARCKTNCPACARLCPEAAIIFPKDRAGPINGDETRPDDLQREKMKVDVSALIQGDIYEVLRSRGGQSQPANELDPARAIEERERCSCDSREAGTVVPAEALLSSPKLRELRSRVQKAKAVPQRGDGAAPAEKDSDQKEGNGRS